MLRAPARLTGSGYIKSRFLDDNKLSVGILLGLCQVHEGQGPHPPPPGTYAHVTVYEEVGHGGAASVPRGSPRPSAWTWAAWARAAMHRAARCPSAPRTPAAPSYEVVGKLIDAARRTGADYTVDVYPHGSDVEATLSAGNDLRHGLIGAGSTPATAMSAAISTGVWNTLRCSRAILNFKNCPCMLEQPLRVIFPQGLLFDPKDALPAKRTPQRSFWRLPRQSDRRWGREPPRPRSIQLTTRRRWCSSGIRPPPASGTSRCRRRPTICHTTKATVPQIMDTTPGSW